jgi:uncharacterized membrane protein YfcA
MRADRMIAGIPLETLEFLWLGALIGGIAAGASGFAFGLAASAIWLHKIDPMHSAILITASGVLLHCTTLWPLRRHIEFSRLSPFVIGGVIGVPIGVYLLAYTDAATLKVALGIFLVAFGTYALLAPKLPSFTAGGRTADGAIGFIGGILGGIGGYSGVLPTIWTQLRGWSKEMARAVYQPYVIVIQAITVAGILLVAFDRTSLVLFAAILPPVLLGTWIGWQLFGKLDDRRFRQALAVLLIVSGATLVL